ncbi:MAG: glycoside hydrolase family 92 protein [Deltaproteobacteria bacterium]|nr:glycoside hydrolase family 92 protein [Deltaproteobacteria bacterium]MCB9786445.1 glycoside hydrolase family 92 protein [Deltaproteobacteria bacterium]
MTIRHLASPIAVSALAALWALSACGTDPASPGPDASVADADASVADADAAGPDASGDTAVDGDGTADVELPPAFDPLDWVDPFIGTGATGINFGALYPGPQVPFGMVALSPDTDGFLPADFGPAHAGGYFYDDTQVLGFSHIHLAGTGVADYGNLLVVPATGDPATLLASGNTLRLPLDHTREHASPGYYSLETDEVLSELTATARTGVHRYTFAPTSKAMLVLDVTRSMAKGRAEDSLAQVDATTGEITGYVHNWGEFSSRFQGFELYFVARPSRVPSSVATWDADGYHADSVETSGPTAGVVLGYDASNDGVVELRVGISFVDLDGARANLEAESAGVSFDAVHEAAAEAWRESLRVVEVEGGTDTRRTLLFTALYHTQLMPTLLTDVDGRYRGIDKEVYTAEGFTYYSDLSLWDTYRTLHPMVGLLFPTAQHDFVHSLLAMGAQQGSYPRWPLATGDTGSMLGTSADIVIGDAIEHGITDFDVSAALASMKATANGDTPPGNASRGGVQACLEHGYCPTDMMDGAVSKTLEYAADDYCVARVAREAGDTQAEAAYLERSHLWKNLFEPAQGFLAPRNADGSFDDYTGISGNSAYVEGNAWQYLFMVPHDVPGLVDLLGGAEAFVTKLDRFMTGARDTFNPDLPSLYYWHGNEPNLVAPFLFGFGGRPELTRAWTHWVADTVYTATPAGLAGNDDGGTLSAWYVFAAAGIYPLPCTGRYVLSAPLFDRVVWHMPGGDLDVRLGADPQGPVKVDGVVHTEPTLDRATLMAGAQLELPPPPSLP